MMQTIFYMLLITTSSIFMLMSHPMTMGLMLLLQATMTAIIIGLLGKTFWFSYILFLIFVGGMLVMFMYVTSIASNEMFSMTKNFYTVLIMMLAMTMLFLVTEDPMMLYNSMMNNEMNNMDMMNSYMKENMLNLNKLYNYPHSMLTIMMIIYLLITLIVVVKITKKIEGPLRPTN